MRIQLKQKKRFYKSVAAVCFISIIMLFAVSACAQIASNTTSDVSAQSTDIAYPSSQPEQTNGSADLDVFAQLYADHKSDVQVQGTGLVTKILDDDNDGDRHQRFIITLSSGQTLLIAHNIDIAPRVEPLEIGDTVEFYGEYYFTAEGGGIHWTHKDTSGKHVDGYIIHHNTVFNYAPTASTSFADDFVV
ncbi:MAG: DUF3465 domain-containing protein [Clostridiales Family XIII bacterium]|nr:DUF3465 domain-containing protein [Clostridiales Family XIII bacterium]